MYAPNYALWIVVLAASLSGCGASQPGAPNSVAGNPSAANADDHGSAAKPLRVMLIPADGGTEEGTLADFEPIFNAVTRTAGLHFDIRVGQAYNAVVHGMINRQVDVAFFGPVTYYQAKQAGAAELLAVGEVDQQSVYYAGIFVRTGSGIESLADLNGKSVAFGDVNSTSSFNFPVAMLLEAGIDPTEDLANVYLTGTHANALQALAAGQADAACASLDSFEKAVQAGKLDPRAIRILSRSEPIPYPPLAMHVQLDSAIKQRLRTAFNQVHQAEGISADQIRGYAGKRVDRYNADFPPAEFDRALAKLVGVTKELKEAMLRKAAQRTES